LGIEYFQILLFINFFFLSVALLVVYHYAYKLRSELRRSDNLRKIAEKFQALFHSTTDGVFQCNRTGRIIVINQAGGRMLGFNSPDEVVEGGYRVNKFLMNPLIQRSVVKKLLLGEKINNLVIEAKRIGGEMFFVEVSLNFCKYDDEKIVEGIFRDITRRIEIENQLRTYSERLEEMVKDKTREVIRLEKKKRQMESLASLGEMAATVVHEVRNPLSSIKISLTSLLKRKNLDKKDQLSLKLATEEMSYLEKVLQDLLNFSRPKDLKLIRQDINKVIVMTLGQLTQDFERANIKVKNDLAPEMPLVAMDMKSMHQVFLNILINAKQAIGRGGEITIHSEYNPNKDSVLIDIIDNGKGIDKKHFDKIFHPFFSTKKEGTGLGLAVVKRIIDAHGGSIDIESSIGEGTKVHLEFPVD